MPHKFLIIAITNDYEGTHNYVEGIKIDRIYIDALRNKDVDNTLLIRLENMTSDKVIDFIKTNPFVNEYKELLIIYSGHGGESDGYPYFDMIDKKLGINEIISIINNRDKVPKLYIIDNACRAIKKCIDIDDISYSYKNELLIIHPVSSSESAICRKDIGSYFLVALNDCELKVSNFKEFIKDSLKNYIKYLSMLKKNMIHPKIYGNKQFRDSNELYTEIMRLLTKQSEESVMATKIGKPPINGAFIKDIKDKYNIEIKDYKTKEEINLFLESKIERYDKYIDGKKKNKYHEIIKEVKLSDTFEKDKERIDNANKILSNLSQCLLDLEKGRKNCQHLNLNINDKCTAKEKIEKYKNIIKHKKMIKKEIIDSIRRQQTYKDCLKYVSEIL